MKTLTLKINKHMTLELVRLPSKILYQKGLDSKPQIKAVKNLYVGKYPVTQQQWTAVYCLPPARRSFLNQPSCFYGEFRPVETISWYEAVEFCDRLSAHTKYRCRLPWEIEWNYACRGDTTTDFCFGDSPHPKYFNYMRHSNKTSEVGSFPPNSFGLYDMHGNVREWCLDGGFRKVTKGGSWVTKASVCMTDSRTHFSPDIKFNDLGFRVFVEVPVTPYENLFF